MTAKIKTTVEFRYVGNLAFVDKAWYNWETYRDEKTAKEAMATLARRHTSFEFRIKSKLETP